MSDYSYCVIHRHPPAPTVTVLMWIESWIHPVRGWTKGTANSLGKGITDARSHWEIRRGRTRPTSRVGLVHTCGTPADCNCNTDRQLPQEAAA